MKCLVTGSAGFIGSHLCRRLIREGNQVTGIDNFADFYPRWIKEKNLADLLKYPAFRFIEGDLNHIDLHEILSGSDYVFHLAAQAGVRASWGTSFSVYTRNNIDATQRLLESAKDKSIRKLIYASSSSVYGSCPDLPWIETSPLSPYSPYGVTKLSGEQLCLLYHHNYEVPIISLRFFTVFGPGQRPDMAFHRFFKAALEDQPLVVFGDGNQTRDFTYVDDIVSANIAAMTKGDSGGVFNIGGGHRKKLNDVLSIIEKICGKPLKISHAGKQKGDAPHTFADITLAKKYLGYQPETPLEEGLQSEWDWLQGLYRN